MLNDIQYELQWICFEFNLTKVYWSPTDSFFLKDLT